MIPILVSLLVLIQGVPKSGGWSDAPDYVKEWLQTQTVPGTVTSCCGLGEAVNVKILGQAGEFIKLEVSNGRGYLPEHMILYADPKFLVNKNFDINGEAVAWVSPFSQETPMGPDQRKVYCLSIPTGI